MDEPAIFEALAAQDAAEALIALGWPVQPIGDDMAFWLIGEFVMDDSELIAFAARQGIQPASDRLQ